MEVWHSGGGYHLVNRPRQKSQRKQAQLVSAVCQARAARRPSRLCWGRVTPLRCASLENHRAEQYDYQQRLHQRTRKPAPPRREHDRRMELRAQSHRDAQQQSHEHVRAHRLRLHVGNPAQRSQRSPFKMWMTCPVRSPREVLAFCVWEAAPTPKRLLASPTGFEPVLSP
jgi:hypothetical protein